MEQAFSTDKFCKDCKMKCTQQYCCINCTKNCIGRWICPAFKYEFTKKVSNVEKKEIKQIKTMNKWQNQIIKI